MGATGDSFDIPVLDANGLPADPGAVQYAISRATVTWPLKTVGIFCDRCDADTGPVDVMTEDTATAQHAVRDMLVRTYGWLVTPGEDLCRRCAQRQAVRL
jgi:hypothetical protein